MGGCREVTEGFLEEVARNLKERRTQIRGLKKVRTILAERNM